MEWRGNKVNSPRTPQVPVFPAKGPQPMNEHAVRAMLEGGGGLAGRAARAALWLPGKAYGLAMTLRREAYARRIFSSSPAGVPVVSVGNLTAGGSGKTPLTVLLARELAAAGRKPAILMRGYRSADGLSDEAALYRELVPDAILEVNPDRRAGAAAAVRRGADVVLLDDGMQHLKLRRDLDLVLVDATSPWGGGNTIPGGLLREPKSALAAAGAVIVTRSDQVAPATLSVLEAEIRRLVPDIPVFTARHRPARLARLDNASLPLDALRDRNVVALSGIARPEAFHATLRGLGAHVVDGVACPDHDRLDDETVKSALAKAEAAGAVVVITEKDRAKKIFADLCGQTADRSIIGHYNVYEEIWTLGIEQDIDGGENLLALIKTVLEEKSPSA